MRETLQVPKETPEALFQLAECGNAGRIGREFLQAQIEVATEPHSEIGDARTELKRLRQNVAAAAAAHGLTILACGTHPSARWPEAVQSPKDRYTHVMDVLQMIGQRNMLCGMHVHVEFPDPARRVDVMTRHAAVSAAVHRAVDLVAVLAGPRHRAQRLSARRLR